MAITYPIEPKDLENGASKNNTIFVDTSASGWVPGFSVVMARQTDKIGGDIDFDDFRFSLAVNVKVTNLLKDEDLICLGTVDILPLVAKNEEVAIVSFPPLVITSGLSPMPTLMGYEFCFVSDKETRRMLGKVWLVPLYDVPDSYGRGLRNVQTRRFVTGDARKVTP